MDRWLPTGKRIDRIRTFREVRRVRLLQDEAGRECPTMERSGQNGRALRFKPQVVTIVYSWVNNTWQTANVIVRGRRLRADGVSFWGNRHSDVRFSPERLLRAPLWVRQIVQDHMPTDTIVIKAA